MTAAASPNLDPTATTRFLTALWPDQDSVPGKIVVARFSGRSKKLEWVRIADAAKAVAAAGHERNVYLTVAAHDQDVSARESLRKRMAGNAGKPNDHRGCNESAVAIPGVWIDLDTAEGVHKATNLPTLEDALEFLATLEVRPTLTVLTGGGVHAYWLFREPWIFVDEADRQAAARLLKVFETVIATRVRERGWHLDAVADLARILRVPGTVNLKGAPKPVVIHDYDEVRRYNPSDLEEFIAANAAPEETCGAASDADEQPSKTKDELPVAARIYEGCAWLRALRDSPQTQGEPQWYAALSILGRCDDAETVTNTFSSGYPGYSKEETARKTAQALERSGPRKCIKIRTELGGEPHCSSCASWEVITSPIQLGYPDLVAEAEEILRAAIADGSRARLLDPQTLSAIKTLQFRAPSRYAEIEPELQTALADAGLSRSAFNKAVRRDGKIRSQPSPDASRDEGGDLYRATSSGIIWQKQTGQGTEAVLLTNFTAEIIEDVTEVGGAEDRHLFGIEVTLRGRKQTARVSASKFALMNWPIENFGAGAVVSPGMGTKDRARHAIQVLSRDIRSRKVYVATGWWQIGEVLVYIHAGGVIGPLGPLGPPIPVEVGLAGELSHFELPPPCPREKLREGYFRTLEIISLAPDLITCPVIAAVYRATLGPNDSAIHLFGETGQGKSELAALCQQHFGAGMTRKNLPGSWSSTANALEALAYGAKDALLVIDDYVMSNGRNESDRIIKTADRLFRAQGNNAGRQRMGADAQLRTTLYPRGTVLSTGEENLRGQSIRARVLTIEVRKGDMAFDRLTALQVAAADGVYSAMMAAFLADMAPRIATVQKELPKRIAEIRSRLGIGGHRRTPEIATNLLIGIEEWLQFLWRAGAIDEAEAARTYSRFEAGIVAAVTTHESRISETNPAVQFLEYLNSALLSGRAHLADIRSGTTAAHGGRTHGFDDSSGTAALRGRCVGWIEGDDVYLDSQAAFAEAQTVARDAGAMLPEAIETIRRRLRDGGFLVSTETRGGATRCTVRRTIHGKRREVLYLRWGDIQDPVAQVAQRSGGRAGDTREANGPLSGGVGGAETGHAGPAAGEPQDYAQKELREPPPASGPVGPRSARETGSREGTSFGTSESRVRRGPVPDPEVAQSGGESGPLDAEGWEEGVIP